MTKLTQEFLWKGVNNRDYIVHNEPDTEEGRQVLAVIEVAFELAGLPYEIRPFTSPMYTEPRVGLYTTPASLEPAGQLMKARRNMGECTMIRKAMRIGKEINEKA